MATPLGRGVAWLVVTGVLALAQPARAELSAAEWKEAKRALTDAANEADDAYGLAAAIQAVARDDSARAVKAITRALKKAPTLVGAWDDVQEAVGGLRSDEALAALRHEASRSRPYPVRFLCCDALLARAPDAEFATELLADKEVRIALLACRALRDVDGPWVEGVLVARQQELQGTKQRPERRLLRSIDDALAYRRRRREETDRSAEQDPNRTRARRQGVVFHTADRELLRTQLRPDQVLLLDDPDYGDEEGAATLRKFLEEHGVPFTAISDPRELPEDGLLIGNFSAKLNFSSYHGLEPFVRRGGYVLTAGRHWGPFGTQIEPTKIQSLGREAFLVPGPKAVDHPLLDDVFPLNPFLRVRWEQPMAEGFTLQEGESLVEIDPRVPGKPTYGKGAGLFDAARPRRIQSVIAAYLRRGKGVMVVMEPKIGPQKHPHDEVAMTQFVLNLIIEKARQMAAEH